MVKGCPYLDICGNNVVYCRKVVLLVLYMICYAWLWDLMSLEMFVPPFLYAFFVLFIFVINE